LEKGVRSVRCFPLLSRGRGLGTLCIAREREETFPPAEVKLLEQIAPQIAIAVDNAEAYREIATLRTNSPKKSCIWKRKYAYREIHELVLAKILLRETRATPAFLGKRPKRRCRARATNPRPGDSRRDGAKDRCFARDHNQAAGRIAAEGSDSA